MRCASRTGIGRLRRGPGGFATWSLLLILASPLAARAQVSRAVVGRAIANACAHLPDPASEAVIAGVVVDSVSKVALPRVRMTLTWSGKTDTVPTSRVEMTNSRGFFVFCHVPAGVRASLMAEARATRGPFTWRIEPGELYTQDILLPLSTQDGKGILVGQVIDAVTRRPVVDAEVRLVGRHRTAETNPHGFFTFGTQPYGIYTLKVSRLGYADYSAPVRVAGGLQQSVEVRIAKKALKLEGLKVTVRAPRRRFDLNGLVQRMNLGIGTFVTADELDTRPMAQMSDILRGMTGLWVNVNQRDLTFTLEVRGRPCVPDVFVDGVRYAGAPDDMEFPRAEDIEAVEVYKGIGEIPAPFVQAGTVQCAVIAVWTRRSAPGKGKK